MDNVRISNGQNASYCLTYTHFPAIAQREVATGPEISTYVM